MPGHIALTLISVQGQRQEVDLSQWQPEEDLPLILQSAPAQSSGFWAAWGWSQFFAA